MNGHKVRYKSKLLLNTLSNKDENNQQSDKESFKIL